MARNLQLMQTLSARICQDLAGSISIIDNCLSLLDTKNKSLSQKAKSLVNKESGNLVKKIKLFRTVYGHANSETEMSAIYLTKLLKDFFETSGIKPQIHFEEGIIFLDALVAKATLCLAIIASEHINVDGTLDLFFKDDNLVKIIANGRNLKLKKENLDVFNRTEKVAVSVGNCREHYVNALCNKSGYDINFDKKEGMLEYSLVKR